MLYECVKKSAGMFVAWTVWIGVRVGGSPHFNFGGKEDDEKTDIAG